MLARSIVFLPLGLMAILLWPQSGWAQPSQKETERTAELLATLLDAGRVVIERNQPLINDSRRGTRASPDVFEKLVLDEFFRQSQIDLNKSGSSLPPTRKIY